MAEAIRKRPLPDPISTTTRLRFPKISAKSRRTNTLSRGLMITVIFRSFSVGFRKPHVGLVASGMDFAALDAPLCLAVGFVQMGAVVEPAPLGGFLKFRKRGPQRLGSDVP